MESSLRHVRLLSIVVPGLALAACNAGDVETAGEGGSRRVDGADIAGVPDRPTDRPMGACNNRADLVLVADPAKDIRKAVTQCGLTHLGAEPATLDCIRATGLSQPCAQCYDTLIACAVEECISPCLASPEGQACLDCREMHCNVAFRACSGLPEDR